MKTHLLFTNEFLGHKFPEQDYIDFVEKVVNKKLISGKHFWRECIDTGSWLAQTSSYNTMVESWTKYKYVHHISEKLYNTLEIVSQLTHITNTFRIEGNTPTPLPYSKEFDINQTLRHFLFTYKDNLSVRLINAFKRYYKTYVKMGYIISRDEKTLIRILGKLGYKEFQNFMKSVGYLKPTRHRGVDIKKDGKKTLSGAKNTFLSQAGFKTGTLNAIYYYFTRRPKPVTEKHTLTLWDLAQESYRKVSASRNIGKKAIAEIQTVLRKHNQLLKP